MSSPPDQIIYARDLDGTGSAHICAKEDAGAYSYVRIDRLNFMLSRLNAAVVEIQNAEHIVLKDLGLEDKEHSKNET